MANILIVDDSDIIRDSLRELLVGAGFDVTEGVDGVEGLEKAKSAKHDLIITDFNMPNMNGLEMSKEIKALPEYKDISILMLTTETSADLKKQGKDAGIRAWIVKPFQGESMVKILKKLVG